MCASHDETDGRFVSFSGCSIAETAPQSLWPQMTMFFIWAIVVTQWNLVLGVAGIFSLAQMALFAVGAYATAMLALDAKEAAPAFLTYLMRADLEDLRQLNQQSVNVYTCTVILRFLIDNPLPVSHPGVASLFLFAVSRNRGLADMANIVLEKQIPEHRASFAIILARLPVPVQVAFIENTQREMTANLRLLLNDLKEVAQNKEVIEELNSPNEAGAQ